MSTTYRKMASQRGLHLVASICAALVLAACGGGGSGSSSGTAGSGNSQSSNGNLATSVPTPTYAAGSPELTMFNQLNDVRSKGGFGMLAQNTALDQAAKNHANYMLTNYYSVGTGWNINLMTSNNTSTGWLYAHSETQGSPGFTGAVPVNRAQAAGYNAAYVAEVIGFNSTSSLLDLSKSGCVGSLLDTVFHRSGLLNVQLRDFGANVSKSIDGQVSTCVVDPAFTTASVGNPPPGWVAVYPYAGQSGLDLLMTNESPDPVPSVLTKGLPVSIYVEPQNTLSVTSFTLTDNLGNQVPVKLLTKTDFPQFISSAMAYIVPTVALKSATTYTVQFVGTNNGVPLSRAWSFSTQ